MTFVEMSLDAFREYVQMYTSACPCDCRVTSTRVSSSLSNMSGASGDAGKGGVESKGRSGDIEVIACGVTNRKLHAKIENRGSECRPRSKWFVSSSSCSLWRGAVQDGDLQACEDVYLFTCNCPQQLQSWCREEQKNLQMVGILLISTTQRRCSKVLLLYC